MNHIDQCIRDLRLCLLMSYVLQVVHCVTGAAFVLVAMVAILSNAPLTGGLFVVLSYLMGADFCEVAASRALMKAQLHKLQELRKEFP